MSSSSSPGQRPGQLRQHIAAKHLPNHAHPALAPLQHPRHRSHQPLNLLRVRPPQLPPAVHLHVPRPLRRLVKLPAPRHKAAPPAPARVQRPPVRIEPVWQNLHVVIRVMVPAPAPPALPIAIRRAIMRRIGRLPTMPARPPELVVAISVAPLVLGPGSFRLRLLDVVLLLVPNHRLLARWRKRPKRHRLSPTADGEPRRRNLDPRRRQLLGLIYGL
ncbi:hypothetical protein CCMA1212_001239 [Trichoderma ghanense]|uniref:Uncharacterized protein n=1 Tax=Trichoderma ghanense TaxID=65468 RepID=A0ABY2HE82_9HYPO